MAVVFAGGFSSPLVRAINLCPSPPRSRGASRLFSASLPLLIPSARCRLPFPRPPGGFVRCSSGSITAKPSSELRKHRKNPAPDEKLIALRELLARPGIGIDAYIVPSEDAHQVCKVEKTNLNYPRFHTSEVIVCLCLFLVVSSRASSLPRVTREGRTSVVLRVALVLLLSLKIKQLFGLMVAISSRFHDRDCACIFMSSPFI